MVQEQEGQDSRLPWDFVPNLKDECLEFEKISDEKLYPINCEQAYDCGFLTVKGSQGIDTENIVENLTNKR